VNTDCLKLTIYFGERDRASGRFLADVLTDMYSRHALQTSLIIRGVEGFGVKHHLHTDRLLSLSEDLPLVSVAVDERARIEALLPELNQLRFDGLVTLERARMLSGRLTPAALRTTGDEATKLTAYVGRHERVADRPAYEAVVDLFHRNGIAGANVLLGVDGTASGVRQRARFFAPNRAVPLMIVGVGDAGQAAQILPPLSAMLSQPLVTLERVRLCKRDGERLDLPDHLPDTDESGMGIWQKLMVHAPEQARSQGHPLHGQVVRALRRAGAAGATSLRGIWGYTADRRPHGDSFWQLRRQVPTMTVVVDTPERTRRWFALIDELTSQTGVVTSEIVPAYRATGPDIVKGGLRLARPQG
jgi:PII-like signaling protein